MLYIVDFDDASDENMAFRRLFRLKVEEPNFCATLFCIPARTSDGLLGVLKSIGWLDPAVHGWNHRELECGSWDTARAVQVLDECERRGFSKVFRAPYWEISDATYEALKLRNWICADHPKNGARRPEGLKVYEVDSIPGIVHGHITPYDNGIEEQFDFYRSLHGEFALIKELFGAM